MDTLMKVGIIVLSIPVTLFLIAVGHAVVKLIKAILERNKTWDELSSEEKAKYKELKKRKGA
jgi:hypothetical protein